MLTVRPVLGSLRESRGVAPAHVPPRQNAETETEKTPLPPTGADPKSWEAVKAKDQAKQQAIAARTKELYEVYYQENPKASPYTIQRKADSQARQEWAEKEI